MRVSVIIPTWNEEAYLPVALQQLAACPEVELIVVDGGSTDGTVAAAREVTPYVFVTAPNRAAQMNFGARHATGDVLLFLHADMFLLPGALEEMQRRLIGNGAVGGAFDLQIDARSRFCRFSARAVSRWARLTRLPRGDQGLFVWRQVFELVGGFPELPIFEDVALARRLRRAGRLTFLPSGLVNSARRWRAHGLVKTALVNWWVAFLFALRLPPRQLRRIYDGWFAPRPCCRRPVAPVTRDAAGS